MKHVLEGTASFINLFKPSKLHGKFDATIIFDTDGKEHKSLEASIDKVGKEKYGEKWTAIKKTIVASDKYPIKSGDKKADQYEGYEGRSYVKVKHDMRPVVVKRDATPAEEHDGIFYAGAVIQVHLDVSVFDNEYGKFVGLKLLGAQFVKDGPRLDKAPSPIDIADFKPLSDGADAEDL